MHLPSRDIRVLWKPLPVAIPGEPAGTCSTLPAAVHTLPPLQPISGFSLSVPLQLLHARMLLTLPPQLPSLFTSFNKLISTLICRATLRSCSSLQSALPITQEASWSFSLHLCYRLFLPLGFVSTVSVLVFCCCHPCAQDLLALPVLHYMLTRGSQSAQHGWAW